MPVFIYAVHHLIIEHRVFLDFVVVSQESQAECRNQNFNVDGFDFVCKLVYGDVVQPFGKGYNDDALQKHVPRSVLDVQQMSVLQTENQGERDEHDDQHRSDIPAFPHHFKWNDDHDRVQVVEHTHDLGFVLHPSVLQTCSVHHAEHHPRGSRSRKTGHQQQVFPFGVLICFYWQHQLQLHADESP